MLPYVEQPVFQFGPVTVHASGIAVAVAVWVGLSMAHRRFHRLGLDPAVGQRLGGWILGGGIVGAHLFSVLFYFPHKLRDDPWLLLRRWEDISSFGGILGGVAGALLFFATRASAEERALRWGYLDAVAFVFPTTLAVGRFGCALAHDHPGTVTTFPLAISLESNAALLYLPVRFGIDFLRVADVRYVGLTPAQGVALVVMLALPWFAVRMFRRAPVAAH